jgi:hypothetical protein
MDSLDNNCKRLFSLACDGHLAAPELAALQEQLRQSPEMRASYLAYAGMHADLFGAVRLARVRDNILREIKRPETPVSPHRGRSVSAWSVIGMALAACLLAGFVLRGGDGRGSGVAVAAVNRWPGVVATVKRVESVVWADGAKALRVDETLQSGNVVKFEGGLLEVEFRQGAIVVLEGPAHFVPIDANQGTLYAGKLAAVAPSWATGFRVATPKFEVIDHGTEFAITVGGDESDPLVNVVVTEGEVEVLSPNQKHDGRRLFAGEGVRSTGDDVDHHESEAARLLTEKLPSRPELKNTVVVGDRWHDWRAGVEGKPRHEGPWRYYTNADGPFGEPKLYAELLWDSRSASYRPADFRSVPETSQYVRVHRDGGHPGKGREQAEDGLDHYSIAGFTVPEDGVYRIESGWLERHDTKRWDIDRVVDIAAHINDGPILFQRFCNRSGYVSFRGPLGNLKAGDTVYVGVGPNGVDHGDRFRWGFYIVRETNTPKAAAAPDGSGPPSA